MDRLSGAIVGRWQTTDGATLYGSMPVTAASISLTRRRDAFVREWDITAGASFEPATSLITYGERDGARVVLKVIKAPADEWQSGGVVAAFEGLAMVRALEHTEGALLLERLDPGTPLVERTASGDVEATRI